MKCNICGNSVDEESCCELCEVSICMDHSELHEDHLTCDYCLGKEMAFKDRDEEDFAGTEM